MQRRTRSGVPEPEPRDLPARKRAVLRFEKVVPLAGAAGSEPVPLAPPVCPSSSELGLHGGKQRGAKSWTPESSPVPSLRLPSQKCAAPAPVSPRSGACSPAIGRSGTPTLPSKLPPDCKTAPLPRPVNLAAPCLAQPSGIQIALGLAPPENLATPGAMGPPARPPASIYVVKGSSSESSKRKAPSEAKPAAQKKPQFDMFAGYILDPTANSNKKARYSGVDVDSFRRLVKTAHRQLLSGVWSGWAEAVLQKKRPALTENPLANPMLLVLLDMTRRTKHASTVQLAESLSKLMVRGGKTVGMG
eukprot:CAMPEP_0179429840 /NCGR_PEP_ID=MMETSP0799-20121207/15116_1 /TAXON_ID=46947 /ORGANISM="Geminigera cryophila, Strain CCMP2564" /LENGTH=302 /DNA_ID=CAMNT_0021205945 /DNA_START=73 /DNA_END=981 /DNA_ORIENTATION=+